MILGNDPAALGLAADAQGVGDLKQLAKSDPRAAVKETARQFEALLLNVMMKSMRETTSQDGIFDSEQTRLYTSLLDQQISQAMSRRGIGIAEVLERQLAPAALAQPPGSIDPGSLNGSPVSRMPQPSGATAPSGARTFVEKLLPDAEAVAGETGIPARFLMGHAALETGWGRSEIRARDGTPSHNLFGIKAGEGWKGRTVDTMTTEYVDGSRPGASKRSAPTIPTRTLSAITPACCTASRVIPKS
jgi:peptidoglycan hydrolase FlgJ